MKKLSWVRTLFHILGAAIPLIYLLSDKETALAVTTSLLVLLVVADFLRIRGHLRSNFVERQLKDRESTRPTASLFYVVACLATILLFDRSTACASIFVLAFSDPLSSVIGRKWGKRRFFGKTLEGTTAFLFSTLLVLACFPFEIPAILAAACSATAAELFSSRLVDDNLTIPLATAIVLALLRG
jgi:glycerol-3-phosphate acyltransferase PlsY